MRILIATSGDRKLYFTEYKYPYGDMLGMPMPAGEVDNGDGSPILPVNNVISVIGRGYWDTLEAIDTIEQYKP